MTRLFRNLTLHENMVAASLHAVEPDNMERISELLDLVGLAKYKHSFASDLSYGQQKLLSFAIALASDPDLVLLDEPVCGVNPVISEQLSKYVSMLRDEGKTFLVIEHNVPFVAALCDNLIVMDSGELIAYGETSSVMKDERVMEAYLGKG